MESTVSTDAMGVPPRQEHSNIPTPQETNDVPPRQEHSNIPTPQETKDVPPRHEHSNIPTTQETKDVPPRQENSNIPNPQEINDVPPRQENSNIPTPQEINDAPPRQEHSNIPTPQEINDVPPIQQQTGSSIVPTQDPNNGPPWQQQANIELPPDPPLNWRLNVLLEDIASNIEDKELDRIKILFRGPSGLGKGALEKCNTFVKLFDVLRERDFLLRGNLVYLNKILYTLNRPDLIEKTVKYCREEGNVVYYYKEDYEEAGYTRSKFHVPIDIKKIDMETIDRIRNSVAKIVCAPAELVLIVAVEPGSSLLVTLKLPTMYSQILQHLLETKHDLWELTAVGIDTVFVNDKTYNLTDLNMEKFDENKDSELFEIHGPDVVETEQQRKIMNIYEQLEQTKQDLERTEIQAIARNNEIRELRRLLSNNHKMQTSKETQERKNMELLAACSLLQRMRLTNTDSKAAMDSFRHAISDANSRGQDMGIIKRIVDANTLVVSSFTRNMNEAERKKREVICELRKIKEAEIHHQLVTGSITAEQALRIKCAQYTLEDVPIVFNEMALEIVNEVSQLLTEEDRQHLMDRYHWEDSELIKTCVELDKSLLLFGLEIKETELTQKIVDSDLFIRNLLEEVSRNCLDYYVVKVSSLNEHQHNVFFTQAARHFQSQQQSSGLGQAAAIEMQQILATTKDTFELVKKINDHFLEFSSIYGYATSVYRPYPSKKSFGYFPRTRPTVFGVIGQCLQLFVSVLFFFPFGFADCFLEDVLTE